MTTPTAALVSPACFGILCPQHGQCARYLAIEGRLAHLPRIGTCQAGADFPRFLPRQPGADLETHIAPQTAPR